MHRTLKAEATRPPSANLRAQQIRFNRFRHEYRTLAVWRASTVKLGRMNERILRIEDHKGRTVRRGPAGTTTEPAKNARSSALTRRGNTHQVLPMSPD